MIIQFVKTPDKLSFRTLALAIRGTLLSKEPLTANIGLTFNFSIVA